MKKLIAIFFICLLGLHFAPAFGSFSQQSAICLDIEEEKNSDKSKDSLKEKLEKKDFEHNRLSCFTLLTLQKFSAELFHSAASGLSASAR